MITKVKPRINVVCLDKNFREVIKDAIVPTNGYSPCIGYYDEKLNRIILNSLFGRIYQNETVRRGTFGIWDSKLKGGTKVIKLKTCLYFPNIRNYEEQWVINNTKCFSKEDFLHKISYDLNIGGL